MMKGKEKEALVGEVNHHLVPELIYLPEDKGSQSSNHNDGKEKSVDNIQARYGARSIPETPVEQIWVGVGQPKAGHVSTHYVLS